MSLSAARPRELAALYRMVARLVSAGIPPIQRATLLEEHPAGAHARPAARAFARAFVQGGLPSAELQRDGAVPDSHAGVISAGESTGRLDVVLDTLAGWCEEEARVARMAQRLLIEPVAAWLVIALVLPLGALVRFGVSAYLARAVPILGVPIIAAMLLQHAHRTKGIVPVFSEPLRLIALARFCRTLALLQGAGLPLPRSLREAAAAASHPAIGPAATRAASAIERGTTLSQALRQSGLMRPVEMALVADGELTGRVDVAFARAAGLLEHEGFTKARWRLRILAAVAFAIVAIVAALSLASAMAGSIPDLRE